MTITKAKDKQNESAFKTDVLVLLSGGVDSTTLVHFYKTQGNSVNGLFIDYGQISSKREEDASALIAKFFKIKLYKLKPLSRNIMPPLKKKRSN